MQPMQPDTDFPSEAHYKLLADLGFAGRVGDARWHWHAYDYGWRRVFLANRNEFSPIDPEGVWFIATLADSAEEYYRRTNWRPKPRSKITPAEEAEARGEHELAETFRQQDRERAALLARVRSGEANDDEFTALCLRQAAANGAIKARRHRAASHDRDREAIARVREALGVRESAVDPRPDGLLADGR